MNEYELDAYGKLADHISTSLRVWAEYDQTNKLPNPYFYHMSTSALERLAQAGASLGILQPAFGKPTDVYFGYSLEQTDVYSHAVALAPSGPDFDQLLGNFTYYVQAHGGGFRAYPPEHCFSVCTEFDGMFRSFVKIGYVERAGLEYRWTVNAASSMYKARIWPLGSEPDAYFRRTGRW